jgi:hypothetical protein
MLFVLFISWSCNLLHRLRPEAILDQCDSDAICIALARSRYSRIVYCGLFCLMASQYHFQRGVADGLCDYSIFSVFKLVYLAAGI